MRKPDYFFKVRVHPVFHVVGCAEKQRQEANGMFGFHLFSTCPNCKLVDSGYELWQENGHCAGRITRGYKNLAKCLRARVRQWIAKTDVEYPKGSLIGYRFFKGESLYYRG